MKIGILKELKNGEKRVAISPKIVRSLVDKGFECFIEENAGILAQFTNSDFEESGAKIKTNNEIFELADILVKINPFEKEEIQMLKDGQITISQLFHLSNTDRIEEMAKKGVSAFSLDAMPRISRAQDMDVLSSQNNLAGYKSVILGANEISIIFPLMMTAAGTITPARVLIFGVGVAGLQAIATAKRLGAIVEATDIRKETKEQTESLGGKFISVENNEDEGNSVYAKEASDEYKQKQKEAVEESLFKADLVITTAQVPGRKAPILITKDQVKKMKNGAVIIDLAAEQGGNCAYSKLDEIVTVNGVKIIGISMSPVSVSNNASELFGKNVYNFLVHLTDENGFKWELDEEITDGTLITHKNKIRKK
ncbi:MAG: Re/Si-specific NAD(P)(+) transhydrogenase subunit alpha [Flavobacteriaceae bacterium]|nr:Re/Si-specific NAD(P)(+) transhydrogenase subunit alpha [Flavobacteriaceae bacterium]